MNSYWLMSIKQICMFFFCSLKKLNCLLRKNENGKINNFFTTSQYCFGSLIMLDYKVIGLFSLFFQF